VISIDVLSDDILLEVFDFYMDEDEDESAYSKREIEAWQSLVHVCRRWRSIVFGSPRRLNLRLLYTPGTPARDTLDVWPALPLFIRSYGGHSTEGVDNIVAVLERSDRVYEVNLWDIPSLHLEKVLTTMQEPFPELTFLRLRSADETVTVLPDSFLGGSASPLRRLILDGIPFPGLLKPLLSATRLTELQLSDIPHSGVSSEAIVAVLSTLTSLKYFWLEFQSPLSRPDRTSQRPPPLTRSVFPALVSFWFKGVSEYLEDIVARIDTPQLNLVNITFFNQIVFDTPQFIKFICRTPKLEAFDKAHVNFDAVRVKLSLERSSYGELNVAIPCREPDWQVSSLEQVCTSCLPPLSTLEYLYIYEAPESPPDWKNNIENAQWLELLHPFTAVVDLYLSQQFAQFIVPALQELVGGRTMEVLPALQNIFLELEYLTGPVHEGVGKFVSARQHSGHPIAVSRWKSDFDSADSEGYSGSEQGSDSKQDSDSDSDSDLEWYSGPERDSDSEWESNPERESD
jgi:hypothetical protein